jgi:aspartate aminotransferase-like enzyme
MKLFIPGPVNVSKETNLAMCEDMIGHRTPEFKELYKFCITELKDLLYTNNEITLHNSSGTGMMEAAIRNCVKEDVLVCDTGAFGKKFASVAKACGKNVDTLKFSEGMAVDLEKLKAQLAEKKYEAVCVTLNETTTGVENNLEEIRQVVPEDVLLLVDAVSGMCGTKIEIDKLGIDVCFASVQKSFALPPGLGIAVISQKAVEKSKTIDDKGMYFDYVKIVEEGKNNQTIYTPAISLIYGLKQRLIEIKSKGKENMFKEFSDMAEFTRGWFINNGFEMFSQKGYESNTVSCFKNTKGIDLKELKSKLKEKGYLFDSGYRKINEKLVSEGKVDTFRIPHMGNTTKKDLEEYFNLIKDLSGWENELESVSG